MSDPTYEDEIVSMLERMEIEPTEVRTVKQLQARLSEKLGIYSPSQLETSWDIIVRYQREIAPAGYRAWVVRFPWGRQLRWTRAGVRGWVPSPFG